MYILTWLIFIHTFSQLLFWLTNQPYQYEVNLFLADLTGWYTDYLSGFLIFTAAMAGWSGARLRKQQFQRKLPYLPIAIFYLLFFYGSFAILFMEDPMQWGRAKRLFQYSRLIPETLLFIGISWHSRQQRKTGRTASSKRLILLLIPLTFAALILPPSNIFAGPISPKPGLMGHRGNALYTPENSLIATTQTAANGAIGMETDIRISLDGIPFLMHDNSLLRTTNVAELFPDRRDERPENFTFAELSQLNNGRWFLDVNPYNSLHRIEAADQTAIAYQTIPSLANVLKILADNDLLLLFDYHNPPEGHPYHNQALEQIHAVIAAADYTKHVWLGADFEQLAAMKNGGFQYIPLRSIYGSPPEADRLQADGFQIINSNFDLPNKTIAAYTDAGIQVNLWTVDEPWLFSDLWLQGVTSVTTNNVTGLNQLQRPFFAFSYAAYLIYWILLAGLGYWISRHA